MYLNHVEMPHAGSLTAKSSLTSAPVLLLLQGVLRAHARGGVRAGDALRVRAAADGLQAGGAGGAVPGLHGAAGRVWQLT